QPGGADRGVHQPRHRRGDPRGPVDEPEGVRVAFPPAPPRLVVVVAEFRLVAGDVDLDGTVLGAALAGQAQFQGVGDLLGPPAVGDDLTLEQLVQLAGPAPGAVLLLVGDLEARTHRVPYFRFPTFSDADAPQP